MASTDPSAADVELLPFHTFLWKIASRCNINCSYCYVYNSVDDGWRRQPRFMTEEVAVTAARRMVDHLVAHGQDSASIIFHGGEPLLGGVQRLQMLTSIIRDAFTGSGVRPALGMQTNLLLLDERLADFLLEEGFSIGVSLDGPPHVNDVHRVDKRGAPTSGLLEQRLELLLSERYRSIFGGFLCVIDPTTNPEEITDYLLSYNPVGIDYLLPLDNHDRVPPGKEDPEAAPYGRWLTRAYDRWIERPNTTRIRLFQSIINMICGGASLVESIGLRAVDLIVIESNGEIEAVDSLKTTFQGATHLGFHVDDHSFDEVARHFAVRSRQLGADALCTTCQRCSIVEVCGGGYLPHRYSTARGFDNPSVYCADLQLLIGHIHQSVSSALIPVSARARRRAAANGFSSSAGMERAHAPLAELARGILSGTDSPTVVDLGCGDGTLLGRIAAESGATPYGLDLDPERAHAARATLRRLGGEAIVANMYTSEWPWPGHHFDLALIALSALLEAPEDLRSTLRARLSSHADRVVVYAYDDDLARFGSLEDMARLSGVALRTPVVAGAAAEVLHPRRSLPMAGSR